MEKVFNWIRRFWKGANGLFFGKGYSLSQGIIPAMVTTDRGKVKNGTNDLLERVEQFLHTYYEFRFNRLSEVTEIREKGGAAAFRLVDQRELNSLCIEAHRRGIDCWDRDIARFVHSRHIAAYHPFSTYMEDLPEWDGIDRVRQLARRVSDQPVWVEGFYRWMLALTAQWTGMESKYGNSVAPVLVSRRQGRHKSTFCRMLLPETLQGYYTDSFDLSAVSSAEHKLAMFGLINLDELDKFSARKMALLKNLMQMAGIALRKAHKKNYSSLPRIASFIATSNQKELLTDPTGSRRFLCVEVEKRIDCSAVDHSQLYAQLKEELQKGVRYWFTPEEEEAIMKHNIPFQKTGMENDVFFSSYRAAVKEGEGDYLSAAYIFGQLKKKNPAAMREVKPSQFGRFLTSLGIDKVHTEKGNCYRVVELKEER